MKYIECEKPGKFVLKEKNTPNRNPDEALIKIKKVGICGTDYHAYKGQQAFFTYPRILGHELAAEVLEVDSNQAGIENGDRVIVMPYLSCGNCFSCSNGNTNCCSELKVLGVHTDGGMQQQISVPVKFLLKANHLSLDQIVIVEPLAIGAHAIRRAQLKKGEIVVVMGCGPIGIGLMKLADLSGARVIAMDVDQSRLDYVRDKLGIEDVVNASERPLEIVSELTKGNLAAVVFDATGNKQALEQGPEYMSFGGRFVLVGLNKGELTYHHPSIHAKESSILCSRNATLEDFKYVMSVLDRFPVEEYLTHSSTIDEMIDEFDKWLDPAYGVIKASVNFD